MHMIFLLKTCMICWQILEAYAKDFDKSWCTWGRDFDLEKAKSFYQFCVFLMMNCYIKFGVSLVRKNLVIFIFLFFILGSLLFSCGQRLGHHAIHLRRNKR